MPPCFPPCRRLPPLNAFSPAVPAYFEAAVGIEGLSGSELSYKRRPVQGASVTAAATTAFCVAGSV
eukprot:13371-Heterococcus_DN1.PRE.2